MLGISGSGKTSYMAGLAQRMCNIGVGGYTIAPTGVNAAAAAIARSNFTKLMFSSNDFEFPPGTTSTTNWVFSLSKEGGSKAFFEWVDFRGGFIDQLHTGVDSSSKSDVETFLKYAQASDAVLVFVDAIRLTKYQTNQNALEHFTRLPALFQYLVDISNSDKSRPARTLVIVNTKADSDLLPSDVQQNSFARLNELSQKLLYKYIEPLFKFGWQIAICSTGAVGLGCLSSTIIPGKSFKEAPTITATITDHPNPMNVETPLLYCLLQELRRISSLGTSKVGHMEFVRARLERERTLANFLLSKIQKTETAGEQIRNLDKVLLEEKALLAHFRSSIPDLEALVRGKILVLSV